MDIIIELGKEKDIDELEKLYDDLNDYLAEGTNYPGWRKGVYPTREDATFGVENKNLYVAKKDGEIIGTIILNHKAEEAYDNAKWGFETDYSDVFVIHTFAIHPKHMKSGVGKMLLDFATKEGAKSNIKSIRLDVYEGNMPAMKLYEKCGYKYIGKVDLGLREYGLEWFELYEKML